MTDLHRALTRFDLNLLVALDALLSERHVTRAAERMFVSQPAMSGMLQRLRGHFDDHLLVRMGRELELTAKARSLQEPLRDLLVNMRGLMASAPDFDPGSAKREFRLIMSDYCTSVILPALVGALAAEAPHLAITVEDISPESLPRLTAGDADACITSDDLPAIFTAQQGEEIRSAYLFEEEFVAIAAADNKLAGPNMSLQEFCNTPHIKTRYGLGATTLEEVSAARAGLRYFARVSVPSFNRVAELVPGTNCVALIQRRLAAAALGVKMFDPPLTIPVLRETLLWHSRHDFDPGHSWFRALVLRIGREIDADPVEAAETEPVMAS